MPSRGTSAIAVTAALVDEARCRGVREGGFWDADGCGLDGGREVEVGVYGEEG